MTTLSLLSNVELLEEAQRLAANESQATAALVRCLIEVEDRGLHLAGGWGSMFVYCTDVLHLCEGAAYNRISAARTARKYPVMLERLADTHGDSPAWAASDCGQLRTSAWIGEARKEARH